MSSLLPRASCPGPRARPRWERLLLVLGDPRPRCAVLYTANPHEVIRERSWVAGEGTGALPRWLRRTPISTRTLFLRSDLNHLLEGTPADGAAPGFEWLDLPEPLQVASGGGEAPFLAALRAKSVRDALSDADQAGLAVDGLLVEGAVLAAASAERVQACLTLGDHVTLLGIGSRLAMRRVPMAGDTSSRLLQAMRQVFDPALPLRLLGERHPGVDAVLESLDIKLDEQRAASADEACKSLLDLAARAAAARSLPVFTERRQRQRTLACRTARPALMTALLLTVAACLLSAYWSQELEGSRYEFAFLQEIARSKAEGEAALERARQQRDESLRAASSLVRARAGADRLLSVLAAVDAAVSANGRLLLMQLSIEPGDGTVLLAGEVPEDVAATELAAFEAQLESRGLHFVRDALAPPAEGGIRFTIHLEAAP